MAARVGGHLSSHPTGATSSHLIKRWPLWNRLAGKGSFFLPSDGDRETKAGENGSKDFQQACVVLDHLLAQTIVSEGVTHLPQSL